MGNLFSAPEPPPAPYNPPLPPQTVHNPPAVVHPQLPLIYHPPAITHPVPPRTAHNFPVTAYPVTPDAGYNSLQVTGPKVAQAKSKKACHFHASGRGCWRGSSCRFSHDQEVIAREAKDNNGGSSSHRDEIDVPAEHWTRELRGTWVQFTDGAVVPKVSLPSDFSAVRLSNIPVGTSVMSMLGEVGIIVTRDQVRPMPSRASEGSRNVFDAIIKVEDPAFAQRVCTRLSTCRNDAVLRAVRAMQVPVPMPPGLSMNRIDCRRVKCSWLRPERTARMHYHDRNAANRVKKAYESKSYRDVLGPTTGKAHIQAQNATASPEARGKREYIVILNGLPPTVDSDNVILAAVGARDRPMAVELSAPSYESVPEMDRTIVMSMFTAIGPLESWYSQEKAGGRYERAFANFDDEAHAREAVASLHNQLLPFGDCSSRLRLSAELVFSASLRVSTRVYEVVKKRLNGLNMLNGPGGKKQMPVWDPRYVRLSVLQPRGLFRLVKIEGKDRAAVAQAKDAAGRILNGDVLRRDGIDLWSDAFRNANSSEVVRLTSMEPTYGVVLMRDVRNCQLRVFGPEAEYEHVADAVHAIMADFAPSSSPGGGNNGNSSSYDISLSDDGFRWVITGGMHELRRHLGRGKAVIDVRPTGSRYLTITGSPADRAKALRLLRDRQAGSSKAVSAEGECPICLGEVGEADGPTALACGHVYCADCFANFCAAGASSGGILCIGGAGSCRRALSLAELHAHLASAALEDVLAAALDAYVQRHARELRNCPTPDCTHVYRTGSASAAAAAGANDAVNVFTCGSCRASTCRLCHAAHPDEPCAVRQAAEDAQMRRAKAELGLQDCPRCGVAIEKNEGCNHMTCFFCKVHFCWKCLAAFRSDSDCYQHMRQLHGDIYG